MRVATSLMFGRLSESVQEGLRRLMAANERLSSGKKVNRPSDAPIAMGNILDYRVEISSADRHLQNIQTAESRLTFAGQMMSKAGELAADLLGLAMTGSRGNLSSTERDFLSQEAAAKKDFLFSIANTKFGDGYLFSGFMTDTPAFGPAYAYQGDGNTMDVPINDSLSVGANVPGSEAFAYVKAAADSVTLADGSIVHYSPGSGSTVNVEIRASDDVTVLDGFSYDNIIHLADIVQNALAAGDTHRVQALVRPLEEVRDRIEGVTTDIQLRLRSISMARTGEQASKLFYQKALSYAEDAEAAESIVKVQMAQTALEAMRQSAASVMSRSLMDFLR